MRGKIARAHASLVMVFICAVSVRASSETNGPNGINSIAVPYTGEGIGIGLVDFVRPGLPDFDNGSNSNFGTVPAGVFLVDGRVNPTANEEEEIYDIEDNAHATWVAGIMISTDPVAPGVATDAKLFATNGGYITNPVIPIYDRVALSTQFIANQNGGDVRAIAVPIALPFDSSGPDGNSTFTEFLDWSAMSQDVLYVVANRRNDSPMGVGQPLDLFNGMVIAASSRTGDGVYRKVAPFEDLTVEPTGPRTLISLMAPGDDVQVADVGGPIPATVS